MDQLFQLIDCLLALKAQSASCRETVQNVVLTGHDDITSTSVTALFEVASWAAANEQADSISVEVDDEVADLREIESMIADDYLPHDWKVVVSKAGVSNFILGSTERLVFFISSSSFDEWITGFDPLRHDNNPFVEGRKLTIVAPNFEEPFGGECLTVLPIRVTDGSLADVAPSRLPSEQLVKEYVHLLPEVPVRLVPQAFALSWGGCDQDAAAPLRNMAAMVMAACLADVVYSHERVVIKAVRHFETFLADDQDVKYADIQSMEKAVVWAYEERVDTRKRLLADRLALDADENKPLVGVLVEHVASALMQAQDQYRFVILDRKDEYAKELRALLKDIREHAELYADKTRSLVSSLSRDALAAFLFAGLSLTRLGKDVEIILTPIAGVFFKALSLYFALSFFLNAIASIRDLRLSDSELNLWSGITREYISPEKLKSYTEGELEGRKETFWLFLTVVFVLYAVLAVGSWCLPTLAEWSGLLNVAHSASPPATSAFSCEELPWWSNFISHGYK